MIKGFHEPLHPRSFLLVGHCESIHAFNVGFDLMHFSKAMGYRKREQAQRSVNMPITPQELIANLGDLPPLPQVAAQVLRLAADPDSTTEDLQQDHRHRPGPRRPDPEDRQFRHVRHGARGQTLTQAIMTLGFSTIKSIVIASSASNLYNRGGTGLQERLLWEHALVSALAGRAYAKAFRSPRVEEAFLGGLLHDIGKSVMGVKFPERYGTLVRSIYNEDGVGLDLGAGSFGFDHAMVGEALLILESRPQPGGGRALAPRSRHAPEDHQDLAAFVALANHLALEEKVGIGDPHPWKTPPGRPWKSSTRARSPGRHQGEGASRHRPDKTMIAEF